ncbi:MAG: hypothetical protein JKY31_11590 [Rhodobacteraceae bacterium]|nr:hypothetical protein [Paracoccaceae bacterium]
MIFYTIIALVDILGPVHSRRNALLWQGFHFGLQNRLYIAYRDRQSCPGTALNYAKMAGKFD